MQWCMYGMQKNLYVVTNGKKQQNQKKMKPIFVKIFIFTNNYQAWKKTDKSSFFVKKTKTTVFAIWWKITILVFVNFRHLGY